MSDGAALVQLLGVFVSLRLGGSREGIADALRLVSTEAVSVREAARRTGVPVSTLARAVGEFRAWIENDVSRIVVALRGEGFTTEGTEGEPRGRG